MRKIPALLGAIATAGSSLIVAASMAQQPAAGTAAPPASPVQAPNTTSQTTRGSTQWAPRRASAGSADANGGVGR